MDFSQDNLQLNIDDIPLTFYKNGYQTFVCENAVIPNTDKSSPKKFHPIGALVLSKVDEIMEEEQVITLFSRNVSALQMTVRIPLSRKIENDFIRSLFWSLSYLYSSVATDLESNEWSE